MSARDYQITSPGDYQSVKVKHEGGMIYVLLHNEGLMSYATVNQIVELKSGGWRTRTTRMALNTGLSQLEPFKRFRVIEENKQWVITDGHSSFPFVEGMRMTRSNGEVTLL